MGLGLNQTSPAKVSLDLCTLMLTLLTRLHTKSSRHLIDSHIKVQQQSSVVCFSITEKDCGPPVPKQNESFNISAGTLFGAVIKVICDKG